MQIGAELAVTTAQDTTAGRKEENEDSMGIFVPKDPQVLTSKGVCAVIADGVSAADAGREAAETCVQNFLNDYFSTPDTWTVQTSAQKVLTALNRWLYGRSGGFTDAQKGYVCTLSILIIKSRTAYFFHVGDTRIYLLRKGVLTQITRDHSITMSKRQSYLSRAMGLDSNIDVDYQKRPVEAGDIFLLTSDGIHDYVSKERITSLINDSVDFETASKSLIDEATNNDSPDNLTCQLVRVNATPNASADEYLKRLTELPFPPELSKGMILDGFRVEKELHLSARSQLYLVTKVSTNESFVMKTPSVNYEDDPAYIERFILEHWIGTRVKSKHLMQNIDPPESRSCLYNIMEYIEGPTIREWINAHKGHPVSEAKEVVTIIAQITRGLYALHRKEILHQDLKPANIVLGSDNIVRIIDYGSCFVSGIDEIAAPIVRDKILGTVSYAAPEYSLGYSVGPNSDLYSLACIAYEMLTGHHPYGEAADQAKSPTDFAKLTYTPAYAHNPHIPIWLDGTLRKAVRIQPQDRYQELSEFLFDLENPNAKHLLSGVEAASAKGQSGSVRWRALALCLLITQAISLVLLARSWG